MAKASSQKAVLDFAFFQYLWNFYQQNRGMIHKHYKELSKKYLAYNNPEKNPNAFLRQPQYEALEIYIFLKEFLGNDSVEKVFRQWFEKKGRFAGRTEGGIMTGSPQLGIFDKITQDQYQAVFARMRKNARTYPNYIFALTMGTGKTILMATCIFYEFLLAKKFPKDKRFCHNALVFAPDKTVLQSLREIESFEMHKVVPPEHVAFLTAHIKFHYLEDAGTALSTLDESMFNVIVSNTQKIILKRQHKEKSQTELLFSADKPTYQESSVYAAASDLYDFDQPEDEAELTTNQRFEKLCRLGQLGIFVDEAHHAFGKALAKDMGIGAKETDTSLRTTIDKLASSLRNAGTHVVACYNYTGTPYVGREVLPEVVYAYGLKDAIDKGYLKKVQLHGYSNTRTEEFVRIAVDHFLEQTANLMPEGMLPKLAFFAATVEELVSELRPAVEKVLSDKGIPTSHILVNVGDNKITTNDDIREFNQLDTQHSTKQFILLVNKGREGWNCRSLFGVALYRQPKSKVFVLQASMRCLRAIGEAQHTGQVYLTNDNLEILNNELQQNFRISADELQDTGKDKERIAIHVTEPPVKIKLVRVRKYFDMREKALVAGTAIGIDQNDPASWAELTQRYQLIHTVQEGLDPADAALGKTTHTEDLTHLREKIRFSELSLVAEISRYLNRSPLEMESLLESTKEGTAAILDAVNEFNELLYDVVIPKLFDLLYELSPQTEETPYEVELVKVPEKGYYEFTADKNKVVLRTDQNIKEDQREKSFHLDAYCFDSAPEQVLFWDLLREGKVKKVYFTGMLTHGQSDFYVQYIDPDSRTVRSYYPDFLFQKEDGSYVIVEVKGDNMIDDPVVQAKQEFAEQMAVASGMTYRVIKGSDAKERNYRQLL